jgi:hypothetical protein
MPEAEEILKETKRLVKDAKASLEGERLLELLPQGEGSGLDADKLDGLHAVEILEKIQKLKTHHGEAGGGGGGGSSTAMHGNEKHNVPFATKCCQICDVDVLPADAYPGYALLLTTDSSIYVCTVGTGELACGGCTFENVDDLPATMEVGEAVFLLSDEHPYIGV